MQDGHKKTRSPIDITYPDLWGWSLFSTAHRWMMALHGRSDILTPENHPNRKSSASGPISGERRRSEFDD